MPTSRDQEEASSRSTSKSPFLSPTDERQDPIARSPSTVAFVPFEVGISSGVSNETRRAVRVQAAKASAAARKRTIARRLAERQGSTYDEATSSSVAESDRGRRASTTLSVPSAPVSAVSTAPPSPALTPARSLSFRSVSAGQLERFPQYPTTRWHPQIPALVDYFLSYFAPESTRDLFGREAMRTQLWPEAMKDTALFHALLLMVASHATVTRAQTIPTQLLVQLKHTTIQSINDGVARSDSKDGIADSVIGAIALLGGWELEYGDPATYDYDTHMRGLETVVNLRGGIPSPHAVSPAANPISPTVVSLVLNAGHDLALSASKKPSFQSPETRTECTPAIQQTLPSTFPAGFQALRTQRLLLPNLMQIVSRLESLEPRDPVTTARLESTQQQLKDLDLASVTRSSYSPTQTLLEESITRQVGPHLRLAGLSICGYLRLASTIGSNAHEDLQALYGDALQLQPELLVGTVYDELTFWALLMICSTTGQCETRHMRTLKRLQLEIGVEDWSGLKKILEQFVYPTARLESRVYALWEAVSSSTVAKSAQPALKEPTRYAKGTPHPMTYVGAAVVKEEG